MCRGGTPTIDSGAQHPRHALSAPMATRGSAAVGAPTPPVAQGASKADAAKTASSAWRVGDHVQGKYLAQTVGAFAAKWYNGTVTAVHGSGACDITYEDGDYEEE